MHAVSSIVGHGDFAKYFLVDSIGVNCSNQSWYLETDKEASTDKMMKEKTKR
jgi:hypothetical protein